jgi:hypothetical protein
MTNNTSIAEALNSIVKARQETTKSDVIKEVSDWLILAQGIDTQGFNSNNILDKITTYLEGVEETPRVVEEEQEEELTLTSEEREMWANGDDTPIKKEFYKNPALFPKTCPICNNEFSPKYEKQVYCCKKCSTKGTWDKRKQQEKENELNTTQKLKCKDNKTQEKLTSSKMEHTDGTGKVIKIDTYDKLIKQANDNENRRQASTHKY